ncbi:thiamine phosphate synthase [Flavobacterium sp. '19STA2R22 D10 B1']|uniref:thiamine phosphate synthase n=1 Tax=Flavobacterium aerium TaxID=3037261 RepID=UPI00278C3E38|nr:thiamine phosphate synthase [Flavobacterium sp. '19STA2R22 D10 B1']
MKQYTHYISQGSTPEDHLQNIETICRAGGTCIQLRLKDYSDDIVLETALKAQKICKTHQAIFIINDYVTIAKEIQTDGVHIGKTDMSPLEARKLLGDTFIIGGTANTFEDIEELNAARVDYIGLGPFRSTTTKKNLSPLLHLSGYESISRKVIEAKITVPIVAIGGIQFDDIPLLAETAISGIALSGLLTHAKEPALIINYINHIFNER